MTATRLKQIALATAGVIFLWGAVEIVRGGFDDSADDFRVPSVTAAEADSVVFRRLADTVELTRDGAQWLVNGHRAGSTAVAEFFTVLTEAPPGQLVARASGTHLRLEIDSTTAREVEVFGAGTSQLHLLVGKRGRSFQEVYLREPGASPVYLVRTDLPTHVDRPVDEWRDKMVVRVPAEQVHEVEVRRGRATYRVRRDDVRWMFADGTPADSAGVENLVRHFQAFAGETFPTPAQRDSADFRRAEREVTLRDVDGGVLAALALDSTTLGFWVQRVGDTTVYKVTTYNADRITPIDTTLRQ